MAGLTQVIRESLEKLASKEGKSADEVFQVYRQKFGADAADEVIQDARRLEAPGGIPERDATMEERLRLPASREGLIPSQERGLVPAVKGERVSAQTEAPLLLEEGKRPSFSATPAPFGAADAAAIERGKAIPPADASRVAEATPPIEAVPAKAGMSLGKKAGAAATVAGLAAGASLMGGEEKPAKAQPSPTEAASAFKDAKAKELVSTTSRAKTPADYQEVIKRFEASKEDLPEADRNAYESKLKELNDTLSQAKKTYDEGKSRTEWAEVAETVGQALVQIGAGYQGMKTGVDLSGVKFNKTDWSKRYDTLLSELKQETGLVEKEKSAVREEMGEAKKSTERKNERLFKGMLDDYLSEKKIQADIRETAQRHKNALELEGVRGTTKRNPELTKARNDAQKRLNALNSAFAQLAAADEAPNSKKRTAALDKFKNELRSIGKDSLVEEIEKAADEESWWGSDYGADSVKKIIEAQRQEAQRTLDMFGQAGAEASTSSATPGKVRMRAPNGKILQVPEEQVNEAEKAGATRI